jgi:hypothetical protein
MRDTKHTWPTTPIYAGIGQYAHAVAIPLSGEDVGFWCVIFRDNIRKIAGRYMTSMLAIKSPQDLHTNVVSHYKAKDYESICIYSTHSVLWPIARRIYSYAS